MWMKLALLRSALAVCFLCFGLFLLTLYGSYLACCVLCACFSLGYSG